jgi:hypothetical protein
VFLHDCADAIWSLKKQETYIFLFWLLLFVKKFQPLCKECKIFHLKSDDNHRSKTIPTSTRSKHTSHHHDIPITNNFWHWPVQSTYYVWWIFDIFDKSIVCLLISFAGLHQLYLSQFLFIIKKSLNSPSLILSFGLLSPSNPSFSGIRKVRKF